MDCRPVEMLERQLTGGQAGRIIRAGLTIHQMSAACRIIDCESPAPPYGKRDELLQGTFRVLLVHEINARHLLTDCPSLLLPVLRD